MKHKKNDVMLIGALLLCALLSALFLYLTRKPGAQVAVLVDNKLIETYPLDTDIEVKIGEDEAYNVLVIKDGYAFISKASCPDKLCVSQGKINLDGQTVVCLPNKVVLEIRSGQQSDIDSVTN